MTKRNMVVSLIGRPNVGKSSLFNSLMKKQHKALTYDRPGVTRDRHYGIARFDDCPKLEEKDMILVDTGGFYPQKIEEDDNNANKFFNIMTKHAETAIEESDLVLFVVDVREGVLPFDKSIADYIRSQKKEFWLLVNKFDNDSQAGAEIEFYSLGVDELLPVSAAHQKGIADLREKLHEKADEFEKKAPISSFLQKGVTPRENVVARLALIGAPNAGKSTLLNQLLGAERALVSNIPGTTVDPIEGFFDLYFGQEAKELDRHQVFSKDDKALVQQYDEFRQNNPEFFDKMLDQYDLESESLEEHFDAEGIEQWKAEREAQLEMAEEAGELEVKEQVHQNEISDELVKEIFEDEAIDSESEEAESEGSFWRSLHLVDTAGIRRKSAITDTVEEQSVFRSLRCISESDIVLFLVDATKGIGHQDRRLLDIALDKGKSVIVLLNKMDLLKEKLATDQERKKWLENLRIDIPWLNFCDLITISAKYNKGLKRLRQAMVKTILVRRRSIPTGELNRTIFGLVERNPVVVKRTGGKRFKVKYASMIKSGPPTFLLFTNKSKGIPENYKRYLRNGLRKEFDFDNTPVHIIFRTGSDLNKRMKKVSLKE